MNDDHNARIGDLQERMAEAGLDVFVAQDPDSIYALSGYWGYLGMEFGRATLLVVPRAVQPVLITPTMEAEMARKLAVVEDLLPWTDGLDGEWVGVLAGVLGAGGALSVAVERDKTHPRVLAALHQATGVEPQDARRLIWALRMVQVRGRDRGHAPGRPGRGRHGRSRPRGDRRGGAGVRGRARDHRGRHAQGGAAIGGRSRERGRARRLHLAHHPQPADHAVGP